MNIELNYLNVESSKEKKELQAIISDLTAKQAELNSLAETQKAERK